MQVQFSSLLLTNWSLDYSGFDEFLYEKRWEKTKPNKYARAQVINKKRVTIHWSHNEMAEKSFFFFFRDECLNRRHRREKKNEWATITTTTKMAETKKKNTHTKRERSATMGTVMQWILIAFANNLYFTRKTFSPAWELRINGRLIDLKLVSIIMTTEYWNGFCTRECTVNVYVRDEQIKSAETLIKSLDEMNGTAFAPN